MGESDDEMDTSEAIKKTEREGKTRNSDRERHLNGIHLARERLRLIPNSRTCDRTNFIDV